jgi:hypothetical protein
MAPAAAPSRYQHEGKELRGLKRARIRGLMEFISFYLEDQVLPCTQPSFGLSNNNQFP